MPLTLDDATILVTGGAGFIGSAVIRRLIRHTGARVVNLDKLTYAANLAALEDASDDSRYTLEVADICDGPAVRRIIEAHRPNAILHLAAESHVDRSIDEPAIFIQTNIVGTQTLLSEATRYWSDLDNAGKGAFRFHHVSTDEVFGSLSSDAPAFRESSPYDPRSPYAASKAAADHLVRAWGHTYGLPVVLSNCSNNYGLWQFPEKLIPLMISALLRGRPAPIYGDGSNRRDWLHVEDHASALLAVLTRGRIGGSYNIGGDAERTNLQIVQAICAALTELRPLDGGRRYEDQITFVADRPGHDFRYAIDARHIADSLGWRPETQLEDGLRDTVKWYLDHEDWWRDVGSKIYDGDRLGTTDRS
ncbi:MAG: dTDP-glucose 4,6-dehydratase [Alphaproteobacteria bacterium]|nr:dTDP-glucose 4,6-dehydratase [Alphaproteobacteria bacterium]